jgi:hypothetical protein
MTNTWNFYKRTGVSEMRPYVPGEDTTGISISEPDLANGSPKLGDMIARNPKNYSDQWLVAEKYFLDNFEPAGMSHEENMYHNQIVTLEEKCDVLENLSKKLADTLGVLTSYDHFHRYPPAERDRVIDLLVEADTVLNPQMSLDDVFAPWLEDEFPLPHF